MKQIPIKVGVAGTHSTGKSTFLSALSSALEERDLKVCRIGDFASKAKEIGFPILTDHTFESTMWIIAECLKQEAEASLVHDVILVDRPVIDALGYLYAALEVSGRTMEPRRIEALHTIVRAHTPDYDRLIVTSLDRSIQIGEGRDLNQAFREAAAKHMDELVKDVAPNATRMTSENAPQLISDVRDFVFSRVSLGKTD